MVSPFRRNRNYLNKEIKEQINVAKAGKIKGIPLKDLDAFGGKTK